jgi:hypothetical protein
MCSFATGNLFIQPSKIIVVTHLTVISRSVILIHYYRLVIPIDHFTVVTDTALCRARLRRDVQCEVHCTFSIQRSRWKWHGIQPVRTAQSLVWNASSRTWAHSLLFHWYPEPLRNAQPVSERCACAIKEYFTCWRSSFQLYLCIYPWSDVGGWKCIVAIWSINLKLPSSWIHRGSWSRNSNYSFD